MSFKIIDDGDFTTAKEAGPTVFDTALLTNNLRYIARQDFMQNFLDFSPLAFGTFHPTLTDYRLVRETPLENVGCGVAKWTRVYCIVPDSWSDYRTHSYKFPGFCKDAKGDPRTVADSGEISRAPFTKVVISRIRHDYYLVGPGLPFPTVGDIPIINSQQFYMIGNSTFFVDYLNDAPVSGTSFETVPSLTTYSSWIGGMVTGAVGAIGNEIVAEDSSVEQWMGPIYERITRYVKPQ